MLFYMQNVNICLLKKNFQVQTSFEHTDCFQSYRVSVEILSKDLNILSKEILWTNLLIN